MFCFNFWTFDHTKIISSPEHFPFPSPSLLISSFFSHSPDFHLISPFLPPSPPFLTYCSFSRCYYFTSRARTEINWKCLLTGNLETKFNESFEEPESITSTYSCSMQKWTLACLQFPETLMPQISFFTPYPAAFVLHSSKAWRRPRSNGTFWRVPPG